MTPAEKFGLVGLALWAVPPTVVAILIGRELLAAHRRRQWNKRAEELITRCEQRLDDRRREELAKRIAEDAEVAWLESLWDSPCAPDGPGLGAA